jgi:nitroreductase
MSAFDAITSRRSVRGFTQQSVSMDCIKRILDVSARAPSGTNTQPWLATVLTGSALKRLTDSVLAARNANEEHISETKFYPDKFPEPYLARRRKVGWDLYGLVGIAKGDMEKMKIQHDKNFTFFGAPVGIIFTIERELEIGSWLDYGMMLQNVMTAARIEGLDTCPQAAWGDYHKIIRATCGIPENQVVVCGMALGYEDKSEVANSLITERAPLEDWVRFVDE